MEKLKIFGWGLLGFTGIVLAIAAVFGILVFMITNKIAFICVIGISLLWVIYTIGQFILDYIKYRNC